MHSDKRNLVMAYANGLIFHCSTLLHPEICLFTNCSNSNACIMVLPKAYICSPLFSIPFSTTVLVTICCTHDIALMRDLGKCRASRGVSYAIYCLKCYIKCSNQRVAIHRDQVTHPLFWSITGVHALTIKCFIFSLMAGLIVGKLFM